MMGELDDPTSSDEVKENDANSASSVEQLG